MQWINYNTVYFLLFAILIIGTNAQTVDSVSETPPLINEPIESTVPEAKDNNVSLSELSVELQSPAVCDPLKGKRQCSLDCRTMLFCSGSEVLGTTVCPHNVPNCDPESGSCVEGPVQGCTGKDSHLCPSAKGFFPHPTDCTLYNFCSGHGVIQSYWCTSGSVYNMYLNKCIKGIPCGFINCTVSQPYSYHTVFKEMYALCDNGVIIPGSYEKCTKKSHFFDYEKFSCIAVCTSQENLPHESDNTSFYRCTRSGNGFQKTPIKCPSGFYFSEETATCQPSSDNSNPLQKIINSMLPDFFTTYGSYL